MITLNLPYPVSTNIYWRNNNGRAHISEKGQAFKKTVQRNYQWTMKLIADHVELVIKVHPKLTKKGVTDSRLIDLDNCTKCVLDSLINVVYFDDKQVKKIILEYGEPIINGGVTVGVDLFGKGN